MTNQTIDYTNIASVEVPEDYAEVELPAEEDEEPVVRNELVYIAGRLFRDGALEKKKPYEAKWVYEKLARVTTTEKFKDVGAALAGLIKYHQDEEEENAEQNAQLT